MIKKICLITVARSGSNWFCNAVKNIDGIKGYYELFHPLQPYGLSNNDIEYLSKIHRDQFSYVDGSIDDNQFNKFRLSKPNMFLSTLLKLAQENNDKKIFFKLFNEHLSDNSLKKLHRNKSLHYIFLLRNILDSYISLEKASNLNKWNKVDTTDIKIEIDKSKLLSYQTKILKWYKYNYSSISNENIINIVNYEDISVRSDKEKSLNNIYSSLNFKDLKIAIDKKHSYTVQDKNESWRDKVININEVERLLKNKKIITNLKERIIE
tara:strand:+ start:169 stop:966 length:798 start_codon:yes stop_codon:yes gene_type:complete